MCAWLSLSIGLTDRRHRSCRAAARRRGGPRLAAPRAAAAPARTPPARPRRRRARLRPTSSAEAATPVAMPNKI